MKKEQITAWALEELDPQEGTELEAWLKADEAARREAEQTKEFCGFLTAQLLDPAMELEERQRAALLTAATGGGLRKPAQGAAVGKRRFVPGSFFSGLAAAAVIALMAVGVWWTEQEMQTQPMSQATVADLAEREISRAGPPAAGVEQMPPALPAVTLDDLGEAEAGVGGGRGLARTIELEPKKLAAPATIQQPPANSSSELSKQRNGNLVLNGGTLVSASPQTARVLPQAVGGKAEGAPARVDSYTGSTAIPAAAAAETLPAINLTAARQTMNQPVPPRESSGLTTGDKSGIPMPATKPPATRTVANVGVAAGIGGGLPGAVPLEGYTRDSIVRREVRPNTESYQPIIENTLQDVTLAPLSTFSIDVDTASYANVRRFLNQNTAPPRDAVRIEELINYFPTQMTGPGANVEGPFAYQMEMAACPWQPRHQLVRIGIKGRELGDKRLPSNLVFLVDVSGSMNAPNKLPLVRQSLRMLAERLGAEDRVAMVVYAGSSGLVLPPTNGANKAEILSAIERLQAGGSTHGSAGIRQAYEQAVAGYIKGGVNRVILCTDGDFNVGVTSPDELERLITEKARSGVFLSVLGYGSGNLKDRTMETLADKGNGNYAYIDSLSEARKVLVEQMGGTLVTIAKDVKIQVEFNPHQVRSYRLVGYENRLLAKEDFNNDAKDAGEVGAGHSVTALYEIVPANLPPGAEPPAVVDELKYQPRAAPPAPVAAPVAAMPLSGEQAKEILTLKVRYKEPEGSVSKLEQAPLAQEPKALSEASAEFKFTAAVAGFGLLLRQSSYAAGLTWDQVRDLARQGKGEDVNGYRGEFLQLIEKAQGVISR